MALAVSGSRGCVLAGRKVHNSLMEDELGFDTWNLCRKLLSSTKLVTLFPKCLNSCLELYF